MSRIDLAGAIVKNDKIMIKSDKADQLHLCIVTHRGVMESAVLGLQDLLSYGAQQASLDLHVSVVSTQEEAAAQSWAAVILPPSSGEVAPGEVPWIAEFLRQSSGEGAIICSACTGLLWVAQSGVDRGRRVTTHWRLHKHMNREWPALIVDTEQILIEHSDLITAGGIMSWIDLSLALIERLAGSEAAREVARHFVVDPGRRDQRRYSRFLPELRHGDTPILAAQHRIEATLARQTAVAELAKDAAMTTRTFLRRFKKATGLTVKAYQQHIRVEQARSLLLDTDLPVAVVANDVGYTDVTSFSRVFKSIAGQSPAAFRNKFRTT